ncbi:MAG: hypothetical protein J3K34DRAFT_19142 [Monoraphidium minutum]|nr:MAG: hypothetical protein J3K34DRAFT_19142 [Monoraphidium minutum]
MCNMSRARPRRGRGGRRPRREGPKLRGARARAARAAADAPLARACAASQAWGAVSAWASQASATICVGPCGQRAAEQRVWHHAACASGSADDIWGAVGPGCAARGVQGGAPQTCGRAVARRRCGRRGRSARAAQGCARRNKGAAAGVSRPAARRGGCHSADGDRVQCCCGAGTARTELLPGPPLAQGLSVAHRGNHSVGVRGGGGLAWG